MTMESRKQSVARLLGALEVLYDREAALIAAGDHRGLLKAQERSRAVLDGLRDLGGEIDGAEAQALGARVLEVRRRNQERIAARVSVLRGDLCTVQASQRRLAMVVPAYGRGRGRAASRIFAARG
jgi:hypothetical protein